MNAPSRNPTAESPKTSPASAPPIRILLVEDNPGDVRLFQVMLAEAQGVAFEILVAGTLAASGERLGEGGIDVVLLDLHLPDSQGLETFHRFSTAESSLPVIVLSGMTDEALAVAAVQSGAQDYLVKGHVDSHLLVRAIRYAIERKRAAEQLARFARELRQKNEQMQEELRMARELQLALLPLQFPRLPHDARPEESALRFFSFYQPTGSVSGDYFDVFPLSDAAAGVFICDVMGHDVRAALITAMMHAFVKDLNPLAANPGRLLTEINRHLVGILKRADTTMYATAFYLVADVARGCLLYANAGHPSPLHLRRSAGEADSVRCSGTTGPALGLFEGATYETGERPMAAGDCLLLFTDGLFEVEGQDEEQFSHDRLLAAARGRLNLEPDALLKAVLAEVKEFSVNKEFADDVCLVVTEVRKLL